MGDVMFLYFIFVLFASHIFYGQITIIILINQANEPRVCLAEKVSNRDTRAFTTKSGKKYYGLFQIPNQWCKEGKPGGHCNVRCEALLDDDIRDDTACAVTIFHREGFKYWRLWETRCKNDNLITSEIYKCPDLTSPRSSPDRSYPDILRYRRMIMYKSLVRANKADATQNL